MNDCPDTPTAHFAWVREDPHCGSGTKVLYQKWRVQDGPRWLHWADDRRPDNMVLLTDYGEAVGIEEFGLPITNNKLRAVAILVKEVWRPVPDLGLADLTFG